MLLAVRISSYGCTWEVWRALKKLELLSARTTLKHFSYSPNFPRASMTQYTHAKREQILHLHIRNILYDIFIIIILCTSLGNEDIQRLLILHWKLINIQL